MPFGTGPSCGTTAIRRARSLTASRARSSPSISTCPLDGRSTPAATRSTVLLPEPFGPMRATTSPSCAWRLTPWSTLEPVCAYPASIVRSSSRAVTADKRAVRGAAATGRTDRPPARSGCPPEFRSAARAPAPADPPVPETPRRPVPRRAAASRVVGRPADASRAGANRPTKPMSPPSATAAPVSTEPSTMTTRLSFSTDDTQLLGGLFAKTQCVKAVAHEPATRHGQPDHDHGQHRAGSTALRKCHPAASRRRAAD